MTDTLTKPTTSNPDFSKLIAAKTIREEYNGRVTAGHATAMHSYNDAYASKLYRILKRAQITIVANPLANIHLHGRFDTFPKRRGNEEGEGTNPERSKRRPGARRHDGSVLPSGQGRHGPGAFHGGPRGADDGEKRTREFLRSDNG